MLENKYSFVSLNALLRGPDGVLFFLSHTAQSRNGRIGYRNLVTRTGGKKPPAPGRDRAGVGVEDEDGNGRRTRRAVNATPE